MKPSIYDAYACTKIDAERLVAESGLRYWASCRQTFIAVPDTMGLMDPIMFHQPLDTCIEFCTDADSGRLLANACEDHVPEAFWGNFYNIGGGPAARLTFLQLMERVYGALGMGRPEHFMERRWFALRNFHCHWYEDSARLNDFLDFQTMGTDDWVQSILDGSPWYVTLPRKAWMQPLMALSSTRAAIKRWLMRPLASKTPDSTQFWIRHAIAGRISAFFRDRASWEAIPDHWEGIRSPDFEDYQRLDHGYDETRPAAELGLSDMQQAARFRGGDCTSEAMETGNLLQSLQWRCWRGHAFSMTPNTVLRGGHWCPECAPQEIGWDYDEEARHNPFFAQVWYPNHGVDEANHYPPDCYLDVTEVEPAR